MGLTLVGRIAGVGLLVAGIVTGFSRDASQAGR